MSVEVGSKVKGKVSGIKNFGAFIELPERKTGLVHISEVADQYVDDINEHLTVGEEVEVKVLSIGDDGKISLSIKKAKAPAPKPKPKKEPTPEDFEKKLAGFLKDSEERISTIKKQTESRRGGRGGKR
ncbi:S1 domain-containing RNA-binding protein [Aliicoccus persicus]|uniref:RNA-binding protein S1 n=1 Tax=Aliicoccus persicus TaxID=930138 RepID=A0A662Z444_9STAP|nr:S1 domain-containing RNA-binding protein [Aliicoccus persicus]SEW06056.1 S1 RNA binding domain protein [Aliicoccus persicus]HJE18852.1 RNA-binding protein S1 [Aliicoccus persicus]